MATTSTPSRTHRDGRVQLHNAQCYTRRGITRGETGDYQGAINDFDKAATLTGINADPHNLLAHTHMHTAFTQLNDGNVDVDNAGPTRELAQADPGIRFLRGHLPCLGLV